MSATTTKTTPLIKPRDIVETPSGRLAKVREVLPANERRVEFLDAQGGEAEFRVCHLKLVHVASHRPWKERKL